MQDKFKSKSQKSQKTVTRKWVDKHGVQHTKTYVYGTKESGYIPGAARRAQQVAKSAKAKAKMLKTKAKSAEKLAKRALKSRESLFTDHGTINQKVRKRLIYQVEHDKTLGLDEKLMFRDWLKANIQNLKTEYPKLSLSSAIGLYGSGGKTIQGLYNTGMSPDEIAELLNSYYGDNVTGADLTDLTNWSNSLFTSPATGSVYRFRFTYNEVPFERVS